MKNLSENMKINYFIEDKSFHFKDKFSLIFSSLFAWKGVEKYFYHEKLWISSRKHSTTISKIFDVSFINMNFMAWAGLTAIRVYKS